MDRAEISFCSFGGKSAKLIVNLSRCNMNSNVDPPPHKKKNKKKIIAVPLLASILYFTDNLDYSAVQISHSQYIFYSCNFHVER